MLSEGLSLERWELTMLLLVGHNPLHGFMQLVMSHELIEMDIVEGPSVPASVIKQKWCRQTDLTSNGLFKPQNIIKVTKLGSHGNILMPLHSSKIETCVWKGNIIRMWVRSRDSRISVA